MKQTAALLLLAEQTAAASIGEGLDGGFLKGQQEQDPLPNAWAVTPYGQSKCPCVGIDQISGYYATNLDYYMIQYTLDTGARCNTWDLHTHPMCKDGDGPEWCMQSWCYVDPCNCQTEDLPGMTLTDVTFQGRPAYWSYETCGTLNLYSKKMSPTACVAQEKEEDCVALEKCAWDGKRCGGKELVQQCDTTAIPWDVQNYGQEDCKCIGLSGRTKGTAYLNIDEKNRIRYPADVGAYCHPWETEAHPDCVGDGDKPAWCHTKWCFVDPCKCKASSPPRIVMQENQNLMYQGKTAYWSAQTCGSEDAWTGQHSQKYCVTQQSEAACSSKSSCAWTGKQCVGKALAETCAVEADTGVLSFSGSAARLTSTKLMLSAAFSACIFSVV